MSAGSVGSSTDWRQRFRSIWHVDTEYREDANHLPIPVCMYAREERSGATISLWRDELLRLPRAPFDTGPDSVMVAFASNAELQCFLALGWPFPTHVLDPYVENIVAINGNTSLATARREEAQGASGTTRHAQAARLTGEATRT